MKNIQLLLLKLLLTLSINAQEKGLLLLKDVSSNEPISGVSVQIEKLLLKTYNDGSLEVYLSGSKRVKISHIGFETLDTLITFDSNEHVIWLTPRRNLIEEIYVNTGYQTMSSGDITGSYTIIDKEKLNQQRGSNVLQRLDNITSGLTFDNKSSNTAQRSLNISVRGPSTINGLMDPLIILDNFPYEGNIENINPSDVESITILKDAAAAAIWGARAGNGVIVITTKKSSLGSEDRLTIEAGYSFQNTQKPNYYSLPQISSKEFIDVEKFLFENGMFDNQIQSQSFVAQSPVVNYLSEYQKGLISKFELSEKLDYYSSIDTRDALKKYVLRNGMLEQTFVNIATKTSQNSFSLGFTNDRNINNFAGKDRRRGIRLSTTSKLWKGAELNIGTFYTTNINKSGKTDLSLLKVGNRKIPYLEVADLEGNALPVYHTLSQGFIESVENEQMLDWRYYPLDDYKFNRQLNSRKHILGNLGLNQKLFEGVSLDIKYQFENESVDSELMRSSDSYYVRNLVNLYTNLDPITGQVTNRVPKGNILDKGITDIKAHNIRGQLQSSIELGNGFLSGIIGAELRTKEQTGFSDIYYGYQTNPLLVSSVDFTNTYPTFVTGAKQRIPGGSDFYKHQTNFIAFYSNLSYLFKKKYGLSFSARKDASNLFGLNTNDKWKPLWSTGFSWHINNEDWFPKEVISLLRMRLTYGYQGNVDLSKSALPILRYGNNNRFTGYSEASVYQLNNPELRWEKIGQLNIALDFGIFNNRIKGSFDIYNKKGTDFYGPMFYDYSAWGQTETLTRNVANMKVKGFDLNLNTLNIDNVIKWSSQLLVNYNVDEVTRYYNPEGYTAGLLGNGQRITPALGYPLYSVTSYVWKGLDKQGNPQGVLNGEVSTEYTQIIREKNTKGLLSESLKFHGRSNPSFTGNITNSFSFNNITVAFNISYKFGYYFMKPSLSYNQLFNYGQGHIEFEDRWQNEGDEVYKSVPSMIYPVNQNRDSFYENASIHVAKGDHIRFQYFNIFYTLSPNILRSVGMKKMKIGLYADNIGVIWRKNNMKVDPEYPQQFSPQRNYALSLHITF